MEYFIFTHAHLAHWVIFGLFMLAGLNIPISEDLLIVFSGVLASSIVPENTWKLFAAVFLGAYVSDWVVYFTGRLLGPSLMNGKWFSRFFKKKRVDQIESYYKKHGVLTLLIGRFIPFGVRNCLFVTAGIGRMPLMKFLIADGIACFLSNTTLFLLSYYCGRNCSHLLKIINIGIFGAFVIALIGLVCYKKGKTETVNK
ncbi:MAG: DedA family protein [Chlamydiales bacterium]